MIPPWAAHFPWVMIEQAATEFGLDALLVAAFVGQESGGVALKTRYELGHIWTLADGRQISGYKWVTADHAAIARGLVITDATEIMAQSHSYGLMQVMGATARGLGFKGYLAQLTDTAIGLHWGCDYLSSLKARYPKIGDVIAAYNAGSPRDVAPADGIVDNHEYVDSVLAKYGELLRGDKALPT